MADEHVALSALAAKTPPQVRMRTTYQDGAWTLNLWLPTDRERASWQWHNADLDELAREADATWPWGRTESGVLLRIRDAAGNPIAEVVRTKDGTVLTRDGTPLGEADIDALAAEAAAGYDVAKLRDYPSPETVRRAARLKDVD